MYNKQRRTSYMKIKSITIEGMHNVAEKTYNFDNVSYLYGKNGAGKSTVLQAIQLALLGYIPGVDKKNEAIFRHAKNRTMSVTCVLDNHGSDVTITRSWVGTGKSVTKLVDVSPEGFKPEEILSDVELPIYNFTDFMNMTANKMKDWFINFLPNEATEVNWIEELTNSVEGMKVIDDNLLANTLSDMSGLSGDGVDYIRSVNTYLKDQTSFLKGNLQRAQSTIQSLIFYDDCESSQNSEGIQAEIADIQQKLVKASKIEAIRKMNETIQERLSFIKVTADCLSSDERYAELIKENENMNEMIHKFSSDRNDITSKLTEIISSIKAKEIITSGKGICPYTKSACSSIEELIEQFNDEIAQLTNEKLKLENSLANTNLSLQSAQSTLLANQKEINAISGEYAERDRLRSQLQMEELIDGGEISTHELQEKMKYLQAQLTKVAANEQYNKLIDTLTADKFKIENTLEILKVWTKLTDANGLQSRAMLKPFENLAASMDSYLHKMFNRKDISVKFNLSEKANSFSFGLIRDDKYIEFDLLSSGEKCLYTLALMLCLIATAKCPLKVIIIDDLLDHLDDVNANKLFEALYKIKDVQLILAGVKECTASCKDDVMIEVK